MFYCKIYLNDNFQLTCFLFTIVIVSDFSDKYDARGNRCIAISHSTYWIPRNEIYTNWRRYRCHVYVYESMNIHATKNIRRPEPREYRYPRLPNRAKREIFKSTCWNVLKTAPTFAWHISSVASTDSKGFESKVKTEEKERRENTQSRFTRIEDL